MLETGAADVLTRGIVPLETTQTEVFQAIQGDALLSASLWINSLVARKPAARRSRDKR